MKIKLQPLKIDPSNPFKDDLLDREKSAEALTQFIKSLDEPYVIAVDSAWGSGKTTFFDMWQAYLKKKNVRSIYFNAWEADFNEDALVPLINEIEINFENSPNPKLKQYLNIAKKVGVSLVKHSLFAATKLVTLGILDATQVIEDTISSSTEAFAKEQFSCYREGKESLKEFKGNLGKFAEEVFAETGTPLIFIVDELDRCRPNYAIQVLEKIKHLFNVKNIVFVLGIDKKQIGYSIQSSYGQINIEGYLARFIDIDYHLPEPNLNKFIEFTIRRHDLDSFFTTRQKYESFRHDKEFLEKTLIKLFEIFKFELRDIEQIISQMVVVMRVIEENHFLFPSLLCFLLILRKSNKELYLKLKNGKINPDELFKQIGLKIDSKEYELIRIKVELEYSIDHRNNHQGKILLNQYSEHKLDSSVSERNKDIAEVALHCIKFLPSRTVDMIDYLVTKIEIAKNFK